ncbi:MAG: YjbQ family protein [Proteobacteria bacterium]|nr:YjbQ family protein [Pseudomonadota bacterium]
MRQVQESLFVEPPARGLHEFTAEVVAWLSRQGIRVGLLTLFVRHTSASLVIQENVDPEVQRDIEAFFAKLVREDPALYRHNVEGPDDMPAHIKGALTGTQLSIPVRDGRLHLGRYQGIFLFEHRTRPRRREIALHLIGE